MDRKRPVIGISAYDVPVDFGQWKDMRCVLVPEGYVRSVVAAGGVPVLIPPTEVSPEILDDVDAMVFTGGSDINPAVYGQDPAPGVERFLRPSRRGRARAHAHRAGQAMPVLGICRGMQLLNVARGGDLIQHLEGDTHKGPPGMYTRHSVTVLAGTHLAGVLGTDAHTHSCHHQAPGRLGEGLRVAATAEDGTVEAIEDPAAHYVVGVLWHPEEDEAGRRGALPRAGRPGDDVSEGGGMSVQAIEGLVIAGERVDAAEGRTFDVVNPATATTLATVAEGGVEDVNRAVAAASKAYEGWGALSPVTRGRRMHRFATLVEDHAEELALLECQNVGMPISDARGQLGMIVDVIRYYAGAVDKFFGHTIPVERDGIALTFREPIGVVGLITPWNFPLNIANWKIAPALAAGNTVVLKPASLTPLSVLRYAELAIEAGIPEGALNVVPGPGGTVGAALVEHPGVGKIGFTGSTEVGAGIARQAAATIKRVTLELGGKSACVVFADADIEKVGRMAPVRGVRELRAGLLRALAADRRGVGQGRAARAVCRHGERASRRDARGRRDRDRTAHLGGAARDGRGLRPVGRRRGREGRRRRRAPRG